MDTTRRCDTDAFAPWDCEQVITFRDESTGLRAVIAVDDTTLGPGFGGVRFRREAPSPRGFLPREKSSTPPSAFMVAVHRCPLAPTPRLAHPPG